MDFRHRFNAKLSRAIELSGEERPINKEVRASQMHDTGMLSFRSSAYSVLDSGGRKADVTPKPNIYRTYEQGFAGEHAAGNLVQVGLMQVPNYQSPPKLSLEPTVFPPFPAVSHSIPSLYPASLPTPNYPSYPQHPKSYAPSPVYQYPQSTPFYTPQASPFNSVYTPPEPRLSSLPPLRQPVVPQSITRLPVRKSVNLSDIPAQLLASGSIDTLVSVKEGKKRQLRRDEKPGKVEFKAKVREAKKQIVEKKVVREVEIPFSRTRDVNYQPYTYEDYLKVKGEANAKRGGLGPVNINTDQWKDQTRRRIQASLYGKLTRIKNSEVPYFPTYQ